MKIGIYAPFLDIFGGGEKYVFTIADILSKENEVEFLVFKKPDLIQLHNRLNIKIDNVHINYLRLPNIVRQIPYVRGLPRINALTEASSKYDLFINQDDILLFPVYAKKNVLIHSFPPTKKNRPFLLFRNPFANLFTDRELKTYDIVLAYSFFTKKWIEKYFKRKVDVLSPPIETDQFIPLPKQSIVLSVGRFFTAGHCKKQLEMVKVFKTLHTENRDLKDWQYHLVGGVTADYSSQNYLKRCQDEAQGYPIYFHINAPFSHLKDLYGKAKIFWHAAGLNEDENKYPERMEHFGMTTVEAMSAGCVPVVINKGGQPEIVRHEQDGFLWNTVEELMDYTGKLATDENLWTKMSESSIKRSQMFNNANFEKELKQILSR